MVLRAKNVPAGCACVVCASRNMSGTSTAAAISVVRLGMPNLPLWRPRLVQERRKHIGRCVGLLQHDGVAGAVDDRKLAGVRQSRRIGLAMAARHHMVVLAP